MDLSKYSVKELDDLKGQIDKEIKRRRRDEAKEAQRELKAVAEKYGFSLTELVGGVPGGAKGGARGKVPMKYRHPSDADTGWSGRGRKPSWVKDWEASGRDLEELRIG